MSQPYWWFQGPTVAALQQRLAAAGPEARFEVHLDGQTMTLVVVPPPGAALTVESPLNESHVCPPFCP